MSISKELLSEVFHKKCTLVEMESDTSVNVMFGLDGIVINLYELAHKCKLWGIKKGFRIDSWVNYANEGEYKIHRLEEGMMLRQHAGIWQTEPEAIFKACEYILDNKDSK
jgi:hypothetical protein